MQKVHSPHKLPGSTDTPQGKSRKAFPRGSLELGLKTGEKGSRQQGKEEELRFHNTTKPQQGNESSTPGMSSRTGLFSEVSQPSQSSLAT